MKVRATYDGTATNVHIANGTNPWVEINGEPVDWVTPPRARVPCPCGESGEVVLPGVLDGMDTPEGVQRCDTCSTYAGDLDAVLALARHVGGTAHFWSADQD